MSTSTSQQRNSVPSKDYKMTSLAFHSTHKQTKDAFASPLKPKVPGFQVSSRLVDSQNLDAMIDSLERLYKTEKMRQEKAQMNGAMEEEAKEKKKEEAKMKEKVGFRNYLNEQIQNKSDKKKMERKVQLIEDRCIDQYIKDEPNIISIFPKITETPREIKRVQVQDQRIKYKQDLLNQIREKTQWQKQSQLDMQRFSQELPLHNLTSQEMKRLTRQEDLTKQWEESIKMKQLENQVQKQMDKAQYDILYGHLESYQNFLHKKRNSQSDERHVFKRITRDINTAIKSHRSNISDASNGNKKNQNSSNWWGIQVFNQTPRTSYQDTFGNPLIRRNTMQNSTDSMEHEIEIRDTQIGDQVILEEEDEANLDRNEEIKIENEEFTHRVAQNTEEDQLQEERIKEENQETRTVKSRMTKSKVAFASSEVDMRKTHHGFQQQLHQQKLNQQNLVKLNQTSTDFKLDKCSSVRSDGLSSYQVRKNIEQQTQKFLNTESQGQNESILKQDAIRRFIRDLELNAIQTKRIAQQAKQLNQKDIESEEKLKRAQSNIKTNFRKGILDQIRANKERSVQQRNHDLAVPAIAGNQGYPPRPEPTSEEALKDKHEKQKINKDNYSQQIAQKQEMSRTMTLFDKSNYNQMLLMSKSAQDDENNQKEIQKSKVRQDLKEIWQKTLKVQELKRKLMQDLCIGVNDDKLVALARQQNADLASSMKGKFMTEKNSQKPLDQQSIAEYFSGKHQKNFATPARMINSVQLSDQDVASKFKLSRDEDDSASQNQRVTKSTQPDSKVAKESQEKTLNMLKKIQTQIDSNQNQRSRTLSNFMANNRGPNENILESIESSQVSPPELINFQKYRKGTSKNQSRDYQQNFPWEMREQSKEQYRRMVKKSNGI